MAGLRGTQRLRDLFTENMLEVSGKLNNLPRGSIYTTIMEVGPPNHNGDGLLGPNSIIAVYIDPLYGVRLKFGLASLWLYQVLV